LFYLFVKWDLFFVLPIESARMDMLGLFLLYLIYGSILIIAIKNDRLFSLPREANKR